MEALRPGKADAPGLIGPGDAIRLLRDHSSMTLWGKLRALRLTTRLAIILGLLGAAAIIVY